MSTFLLNFFPHSVQLKSTGPVNKAGLPLFFLSQMLKLMFSFLECVSIISSWLGRSIFTIQFSEINNYIWNRNIRDADQKDRKRFWLCSWFGTIWKYPKSSPSSEIPFIRSENIPHHHWNSTILGRFQNGSIWDLQRAQFCVTGCPILLLIGPAITAKANMWPFLRMPRWGKFIWWSQ